MHIIFIYLLQCPGKKIVQNWKTKQWPDWLYSTVTVTINQQEDHTKVRVSIVGVPKRLYIISIIIFVKTIFLNIKH